MIWGTCGIPPRAETSEEYLFIFGANASTHSCSSEGGSVLMKMHAIAFRTLTSYPSNAGTELCRDFAGQATFYKANTSH